MAVSRSCQTYVCGSSDVLALENASSFSQANAYISRVIHAGA